MIPIFRLHRDLKAYSLIVLCRTKNSSVAHNLIIFRFSESFYKCLFTLIMRYAALFYVYDNVFIDLR